MQEAANQPQINHSNRLSNANKTADLFSRVRDEKANAHKEQNDAELAAIEAEQQLILFKYNEAIDAQGVEVVRNDKGLAYPIEIAAQISRRTSYQLGEISSYIASLGLLFFQLSTTLDYEWWKICLAVIIVFLIIAMILPMLIESIFPVNPEQISSITPTKRIVIVSAAFGFLGVIVFALTRGSAETTGLSVQLYNASLPTAELSFALCGAACNILKRYWGWSRDTAKRFAQLTALANEKRAIDQSLSSKISTNKPTQTNSSLIEESNSDNTH